MLYSNLNEGVRTLIESDCVFVAKFVPQSTTGWLVQGPTRLKNGSPLIAARLGQNYEYCSPQTWFEASTSGMTDDEAARFGEQAANS